MFLRVVTTPSSRRWRARRRDRANVIVLLLASSLLLSLGYFPENHFSRGARDLCAAWRCLDAAVALTIRSLFRACGASDRSMPACASGDRSPSCSPISPVGCCWRRRGWRHTAADQWRARPWLAASLAGRGSGGRGCIRRSLRSNCRDAGPRLFNSPFPALHRRRRHDRGQPRLHVRLRLHLLEVDRHIGRCRWAPVVWAVVAEVGMFMVFNRLFSRLPALTIMWMAGVGAVVRWTAYPLIEPLGLGVRASSACRRCMPFHGSHPAWPAEGDRRNRGGGANRAAQGMNLFLQQLLHGGGDAGSGPLYDRFGVEAFTPWWASPSGGCCYLGRRPIIPRAHHPAVRPASPRRRGPARGRGQAAAGHRGRRTRILREQHGRRHGERGADHAADHDGEAEFARRDRAAPARQ